jgi:hypothetical protein
MGKVPGATAANTTAPSTQSPELPPHLLKAMSSAGIDPSMLRGAWKTYGLSADMLPMMLSLKGVSAAQVGEQMAAHGVTSADFPAIADFMGIPADQRPAVAEMLKLPAPASGTTETTAPDAAATTPTTPPAGDKATLTPAVTKSATASPVAAMFDMATGMLLDRDPEAITEDRKGLTPEFGFAIGRHPGNLNTIGVRVGVGKEIGRLRLSGTEAKQTALTLDVVGGANLMAGSRTGLLQTDVSLRGGIGRSWALNIKPLDISLDTRVGAYAIVGGVAQAGVLDGGGSASVGARFGGGLQLGPVFLETTRAYTTGGIVDQSQVGLRVGF